MILRYYSAVDIIITDHYDLNKKCEKKFNKKASTFHCVLCPIM